MDKLRAAIYVRVSTEDQAREGYSIEAQKHELTKYCISKDIEVIGIYSDEGWSGKDIQRPFLQKMIKDSTMGLFDVVLVWDTSRLSRDVADTAILIKEFSKNNVHIISVTQGIATETESGVFYAHLMSCISQLERTKIIERAKLGQTEKARQGGFMGGLLLGYDSVNGKLVVNEKESEIIKNIFNWYIEGKGITEIRDVLNKWNLKTKKGKYFTEHSIRYILTNIKYIGKISYGKYSNCSDRSKKKLEEKYIKSKGLHESIIDEDTFNKAQEIIKGNKFKSKRGHPGVHLLSGFLVCPICGEKMYHYYGRNPGKKEYHYYACSTYKKLRECVNKHIRADIIEKEVIERIRLIVTDKNVINDVVKGINSKSKVSFSFLEGQLKEIDIQIKKLENGREKYLEDYMNGDIDSKDFNVLKDRTERKLDDLGERKKSLETEYNISCNSIVDQKDVYEVLKNFEALWDFIDNKEKKQLMKRMIQNVSLNEDWTLKDITFKFYVPNRNIPESEVEGRKPSLKVVTKEDTVRRIISRANFFVSIEKNLLIMVLMLRNKGIIYEHFMI